jgi:hypothetical protein
MGTSQYQILRESVQRFSSCYLLQISRGTRIFATFRWECAKAALSLDEIHTFTLKIPNTRYIDSKKFGQWCITLGVTEFLDFVYLAV